MDNFDEVLKRVLELADKAGIARNEGSIELDDLVHEIASNQASQVNNEGLEAQVKYILTHLGPDGEESIRDALGGSEFDQWVTKCPGCGGEKLRVRKVTMSATGQTIDLDVPLQSDGFEIPEDKYEGKDCSTTDEQVVCSDCGAGFQLFQLDKDTVRSNELFGGV